MEDLGRHVLRRVPVADAAHGVGIDALEVRLVELREAGRVPLGRLDASALLAQRLGSRQDCLPRLIVSAE